MAFDDFAPTLSTQHIKRKAGRMPSAAPLMRGLFRRATILCLLGTGVTTHWTQNALAQDLLGGEISYGGRVAYGAAAHTKPDLAQPDLGPGFVSELSRNQGFDVDLFSDWTATTRSGTQWGLAGRLRIERDAAGRVGNGGLLGPFISSFAPTPGVPIGTPAGAPLGIALRGPVSGLVRGGTTLSLLEETSRTRASLEQAYFFVQTRWLEWRLGRSAGAADRFVGPDFQRDARYQSADSALDLSGRNTIRTLNDISGFSPKLWVRSQRVLGVSVGASFAPRIIGKGVDWQAPRDRPGLVSSPELRNAAEFALDLDAPLGPVRAKAFGSFVAASQSAADRQFAAYRAYSAGIGAHWRIFDFGVQGLLSNNASALDNRDYRSLRAFTTAQIAHWQIRAEGALASDNLIGANERSAGLFFQRKIAGPLVIGGYGVWQSRIAQPQTYVTSPLVLPFASKGITFGLELAVSK